MEKIARLETSTVGLSRRPLKRYGQVVRGLANLEAESGVEIEGVTRLMPFAKSTLEIATRAVGQAKESGIDRIHLRREFEIEAAKIIFGEKRTDGKDF